MGMPAFKAAGTFTAGTGDITPPYPTGGNAPAANDIALLIAESDSTEAVTSANWQGFAEVTGSPQDSSVSNTRLTVYWKRCAGSDTAPLLVDPGNHCVAQILLFTGVKTSGNPWNVNPSAGISTISTTCTATGAETTAADCLVVAMFGQGVNTDTTTEFSGWANTDLGSVTEIIDQGSTSGGGGGFGVATGTKAVAGTYGNTTATAGTSSQHPFLTIPLEGATAGGTVTGVVLAVTPTLPAARLLVHPVGVALAATPSLPAATLRTDLTGVVLTATPSLPAGAMVASVSGVVLEVTPSLPAAVLRTSLTGVVLAVTPSLPAGEVTSAGGAADMFITWIQGD